MSAKTSQITSLTIVYSTVYSAADQWKHLSSASLVGEFPAQRASNAENVSIWWCHHAELGFDVKTKNNKKVPRIRVSAHPKTPRLKAFITWHSGKIYSSPLGQNVAQMPLLSDSTRRRGTACIDCTRERAAPAIPIYKWQLPWFNFDRHIMEICITVISKSGNFY